MEQTQISSQPFLTTLRELNIGETVTYPAERTSYIRSACVSFGIEWKKKFKTALNRDERTISVTRTA